MAASSLPTSASDNDDSFKDSDYGSDFSVEEQSIVHQLLDGLGHEIKPATIESPPAISPSIDSSVQADLEAAVAGGLFTSSSSLEDSLNQHEPIASPDPNGFHNTRGRPLYPAQAKLPTPIRTPRHGASISSVSRLPLSVSVDGIYYPDLSRVIASLQPDTTPMRESAHDSEASKPSDDTKSPLARFRSFPKKPLTVSDFASGAWCELQYWYTLTRLPGGRKTKTPAMRGGSRVHQTLEDQVHTAVHVHIATKEEAFALRMWNVIQGLRTLRETGMTRELEVWGAFDNEIINGVIDELSFESPNTSFEDELNLAKAASQESSSSRGFQSSITDYLKPGHRKIYLTDVKTRATDRLPSGAALRPARVQLFLYHQLLGKMAAGEVDYSAIFSRYGLNGDARFSDAFMAQIGELHDEVFYDADSEMEGTTTTSSSSKRSGAYPSAFPDMSTDPSPSPDLLRYRSIQQIVPLLESELRDAFPHGADSLGDLLAVQYRHREDGRILGNNWFPNDPEALDGYLKRNLQWWRGQREADGVAVEEVGYKCRYCEFSEGCQWRVEREAEFLQRKRNVGRPPS